MYYDKYVLTYPATILVLGASVIYASAQCHSKLKMGEMLNESPLVPEKATRGADYLSALLSVKCMAEL